MLLIGTSLALSWVLSFEGIPQGIAESLLAISDNKIVVLLLINVLLLMVGTFMDMTPGDPDLYPHFSAGGRGLRN